jgi:hypothetical protein
MPISRPQMVYIVPIMTTKANKFVEWPPLIPINCEGQKTILVVNPRAWVLVAKPYRSTLKYPNYKKDVDPYAHVKVFNATIKTNGETFKEYIINAFSYTLKKTTSNSCHNYTSEFLNNKFVELTQTFYKRHRRT